MFSQNRMTSYGQTLKIRVSWVILRGDISGQATRCPDVIIEVSKLKSSIFVC